MKADGEPLEPRLRGVLDRFVERESDKLESVVLSPFPFCGRQLLVVCKDQVPFLHEVVASSRLFDWPDILTHWIRRSELDELSQPFFYVSVWFWWKAIGQYPGWSYWLRHRGTVLHGQDVRPEIPLPRNPGSLLEATLTGTLIYNRAILHVPFLVRGQYVELVELLGGLTRRLMATALLLRDEWEIEEATVMDRFARAFSDDGSRDLCADLRAVFESPAGASGPPVSKQRAYEALWAAERLYRFLRGFVQ